MLASLVPEHDIPLSGFNVLEFAERGSLGMTSHFLSRGNTDGQVKGFAHRAMCVKVSSTADILFHSSKSHLLVERSVYKWLKGCSIVAEQPGYGFVGSGRCAPVQAAYLKESGPQTIIA